MVEYNLNDKSGIKPAEYYYGVGVKDFCSLSYVEALKVKINNGKRLHKQLVDLYFEKINNREFGDDLSELSMRIKAVQDAITFNVFLLKECC